jgi:hypothetical protein
MKKNLGDAISPETFRADLIARLKPADWYLISEILDERAGEVAEGNWITDTHEDAEVLGHNDPETLRGIAFIARVFADWMDDDEEIWADPLRLEKISREVRTGSWIKSILGALLKTQRGSTGASPIDPP